MRPHYILASAFLLVISVAAYAQPEHVRIANKSSWVEEIDYDADGKPANGESASYYYLLINEQENAAAEEDYYNYAYSILTSEGLQEMSDLSFDFDPSYQTLIFHEVSVMRDGKKIDQLSKDMRVIQREESMERFLYDGTKTVVINLKDIRVGDIIEYSFTRKGYNPVHKKHIARSYYFDYYQSIDKLVRKLIVPSSKNISVKTLGEDIPQPTLKKGERTTEYRWEMTKIPTTQYETGTPIWYNTSKVFMISDMTSWSEVGEWAKTLFTLKAADKQKLAEEVSSYFKAKDEEEYILEVIHFVQDEVRYLGFEGGINSHQPYAPQQVYQQRFGDCKDKSLLLTSLLEARGIKAYPMLVNTSLKDQIDERLPSGTIFDHCVVQIRFEGKEIYIDPTWSNQGGTLDSYFFPDYRRGLVIDNDIAGLKTLPEPRIPTTTEVQTFDVASIGGEAMLSIQTTYTGSDADYQRAQYASTPLESFKKTYKEYYANLYPDIQEWEPLAYHDDRKGNTFTVSEKYKIPTFWKPVDGEESKLTCLVQPQSITHYFDVPKNIQQRKTPYYLSYPVDFYHTIHINLPEEWTVEPVDEIIENEYYLYDYSVKNDGRELTKMTRYHTKRDHIPAEKIGTYVSDHSKMYNALVYQLSYDKSVAEAADTLWPGIIVTTICLIAAVYLMLQLYHRYDPQPARYMVQGTPIGGWLVLLAIGIFVSPLRLLYDFVTTPELITGSGWMTWFAMKSYGLSAYTFFANVYNVFKILFSLLIIVLFIERRSSFPLLMSIQIATTFMMTFADTFVSNVYIENTQTSYKEAIQYMIAAAIWIPYLNISQRVKDTFVIRSRSQKDDDHADGEEKIEEKVEEVLTVSEPGKE